MTPRSFFPMKHLLPIFALAVMATGCSKQNATPATSLQEQTPMVSNYGFWERIHDMIVGPRVKIDYDRGYYEYSETPVTNNDGSVTTTIISNCQPGTAVCIADITLTFSPVVPDPNTLPEDHGQGVLGVAQSGNLMLATLLSSLNPKTYNDHFAGGVAHLPGSWRLQENLRLALNLPVGYTLRPGNYPIRRVVDDGVTYLVVEYQKQ